jgi:hypothetical protein
MKSTLSFLLALFVVLLGGSTEAFSECKTSFVTHRTMLVPRFLHPSQAANLEAAANGLTKKKETEEERANLKNSRRGGRRQGQSFKGHFQGTQDAVTIQRRE